MSCDDCTRSNRSRRAVAEAGYGLPEIEPGMPMPAGTGLTRRAFVSKTAGLALAVYGGAPLVAQAFDEGIANASEAAAASGRVLVSVFLAGGIDSLSVLFPAGEQNYYSLRPTLALGQGTGIQYTGDPRLRWNQAASGLATLHGEGKVSVLPAIGYANSDQSHFTSRHYWEVGATDPTLRTGWLGRFLDYAGTIDNPLQGLCLDTALQPSLATTKVPVATIQAADQYTFSYTGLPSHPLESSIFQEAANLGAAHANSADVGLRTAGKIALNSHELAHSLNPFGYGFKTPVAYPASSDSFPHRLASLAAMIATGLPLKAVSITAPGSYDTHATQAASLNKNLQLTSDSLLAFQRDLEARGVADRVLVHVWSEFGRRVAENGSQGTDHGSAGLGFLIGTQVNGKQLGAYPGLSAGGVNSSGNLNPTADFRAIYASIFEQWFGVDSNRFLPNVAAYERPILLKS
ncbi:MAG: DUF1501 domain-containing protein [Actinobacteria bacterium]|uniref:Unannotated protein n=1 Tax=freshwater metagenome TaxID=449393 RepID=A0A6J6NJS8_9ZZZZ|nr:DUF1501 domain-containing protein [Actinomycetota bacterium]